MDAQQDVDNTSQKSPWIGRAKNAFRLLVFLLVCYGIYRTTDKGLAELRQKNFSLSQISLGWLLVSGVFYLGGMVPCWLFWHRTLKSLGQRPYLLESVRAFYIGHLGKYVPGKALVVVIRTALIRSDRVDTTVAATSVFVETLTMMAVGAAVAAAILGAQFREHTMLLWLAIGLAFCAGVPTLPPIFRRLVRMVGVKKANPEIEAKLLGLNFPLMAYGWITVACGWLLFGLSLWAVMRAIPSDEASAHSLHHLPLLTACVALALVAGFLSLLPGGIGIREFVVMTLLAEPFGAGIAAVSAVLLRLVWLGAELVLAGVLFLIRPTSLETRGANLAEPETAA